MESYVPPRTATKSAFGRSRNGSIDLSYDSELEATS